MWINTKQRKKLGDHLNISSMFLKWNKGNTHLYNLRVTVSGHVRKKPIASS